MTKQKNYTYYSIWQVSMATNIYYAYKLKVQTQTI